MQIFPDTFSTAALEALDQRVIINASIQGLLKQLSGMQTGT